MRKVREVKGDVQLELGRPGGVRGASGGGGLWGRGGVRGIQLGVRGVRLGGRDRSGRRVGSWESAVASSGGRVGGQLGLRR